MSQNFDVIVVGAGSAGCVIAARLTEDPRCRVLLIEAGGSDRTVVCKVPGMMAILHTVPQVKARFDWGYKGPPDPGLNGRTLKHVRGRVLGGSSAINGTLFVRGHRANYDGWAADGCPGWSFDEVLPAFRKLEDFEDGANALRGAGGPIKVSRPTGISPVSEALRASIASVSGAPHNDDYNGAVQEGVGLVQLSSRDGLRYSTSEGYLHPNLGRPNLTLVSQAHVHRVLLEGSRAVGVRYEVGGQVVEARAAQEVVLCGGSIGTPLVLMRSGIGPAAHLAQHGIACVADLPVGQNLHDHLFFPLTFLAPRGGHRGTAAHFFGGMARELLFGGTWFGRSVFEVIAFLKTRAGEPVPNLQLHTMPWAYPPNQDTDGRPVVDSRPALTIQPTLIYPRSRGELTLTSSDPHAKPRIDPRYLSEPEDLEALREGTALTREIVREAAVAAEITGELEPGPGCVDAALLREIRQRASTVYHPVGTCRMGSDERAVVGPDLRVRGIDGLRVADASIIPTITGGNTNAPAIMIGERAAVMIRG
jgi:choline dehydrogenase